MTGVLICCFIVALPLLRHCDLQYLTFRRQLPFGKFFTSSCYLDINYLFFGVKEGSMPPNLLTVTVLHDCLFSAWFQREFRLWFMRTSYVRKASVTL